MGYKPKPWPYHAMWALEDALARLDDIESLTAEIQQSAEDGNRLLVVIAASDIRKRASDAKLALIRAKVGDYA